MKRGKNNKAKRIVKLIKHIEEMLEHNTKTLKTLHYWTYIYLIQ